MSKPSVETYDVWLEDNQKMLQQDYGGLWILVHQDKVIFADKNFEVVYKKGEELFPDGDCVIDKIETGDGVIYGIAIQDAER